MVEQHDANMGDIPSLTRVFRYGEIIGVPSADTNIDIWDLAPTQPAWLAPTAPRIHNLVSDNAEDNGNLSLTGAHSVRIVGLTSWDALEEIVEIVQLNGITPVPTVNSFVFHRMRVNQPTGSAGPNLGTITSTAITDGTVTAAILPGKGRTSMLILALSDKQTLNVSQLFAGLHKSVGATAAADIIYVQNYTPQVDPNVFLDGGTLPVISTGTSSVQRTFDPYIPAVGPMLIKGQANVTDVGIDVNAQLLGYIRST